MVLSHHLAKLESMQRGKAEGKGGGERNDMQRGGKLRVVHLPDKSGTGAGQE